MITDMMLTAVASYVGAYLWCSILFAKIGLLIRTVRGLVLHEMVEDARQTQWF
jgi:hypothetical protein